MDDFSAKPGVPNQYGLLGSLANAIAPNKRMLSAMTPTIVSKNGKLVMVVGTPGGATIITSVYQVILNVLDFKLSLQEAVNLPRFHSQWLPDKIFIEPTTFTPEQRNELSQMGYTLEEREPIGLVDAIYVNPKGKIIAVGDSRGDDTAMGE
jgi:gamma-glutamyltranspeptidase/glutathione hydrolase